jgi:serine/threonine protein kinase
MGEVYKARDTRLDRTVAIKVLPEHLLDRPSARQRFDREARAISSLSHPHVCALFDVGVHEGQDYLVMEYLDGESLADRLRRAPLSMDETFRYGIEIAEALEAAHRRGVVHRDLKPGNIVITKSGAKLLDFGLAKTYSVVERSASSQLPTEVNPLTKEGTILGTLQYMSPEQLHGKESDPRSDIFALGAILYEMATGERAFGGSSQATIVAAILNEAVPPPSQRQRLSSPEFDRVVRKCLEKEPDARWQSAGDLADELRWIHTPSGSHVRQTSAKARGVTPLRAALVLLALSLVGAAAWAGWHLRGSQPTAFTERRSPSKCRRMEVTSRSWPRIPSWPSRRTGRRSRSPLPTCSRRSGFARSIHWKLERSTGPREDERRSGRPTARTSDSSPAVSCAVSPSTAVRN